MKVVSCIYVGQLTCSTTPYELDHLTLEDLAPHAHTFYQHKPRMIKYRHDGITVLIFTSLGVRLMGSGETLEEVLRLFLDSLPSLCLG